MHCLTVGVNTIFVACEFVLLVAEKVKFYIELKFILLAVADTADEPFFAFAFSHDDVFTNFGCKGACFVPCGGHRCDVFCTVVVLVVFAGVVGQHLNSTFKNYVECHLVGACTRYY